MGLTLYLSLILFSVSCKSPKIASLTEAWLRAINLQILCQDCLMSWPGRLRALFTSVAEAATGGRVAWPSYLLETRLLVSTWLRKGASRLHSSHIIIFEILTSNVDSTIWVHK